MAAGALVAVVAVCGARSAFAWGPDGHKTVATIADKLLSGTKAAQEVKAILAGVSLADAAVWADCAKAVDPVTLRYKESADHLECHPFEPSGEADMIDFVKRNADNCQPKEGEETCHKQYHYTDISIRHHDYKPSYAGARTDDVTHAITAAVDVLQGKAPPSAFSINGKREALLLLVHYMGDIHQPLHVGAVYLSRKGKVVDPKPDHIDPATDTRGGNKITVVREDHQYAQLHGTWDDVPPEDGPDRIDSKWLADAKAVPPTDGPISGWSSRWASDTQKIAIKAFAGLTFGKKGAGPDGKWSVKLPTDYATTMAAVKREQLTKGGARLAQLLTAIWPDPPVTHASH